MKHFGLKCPPDSAAQQPGWGDPFKDTAPFQISFLAVCKLGTWQEPARRIPTDPCGNCLNCIPHHDIYDENAHMPQHKQLSSPVFHLALFDTPVISANRSTSPRGDGCRQWGLRKLEVGAGFRSTREAMASLVLELREALSYLVGGGPGVDFGNERYPRKWRGGKNTCAGVCDSSSKPVPSQEQAIWPWANYYPSSQRPRVRVCIKIPHSSADMASSDEGSATYRM